MFAVIAENDESQWSDETGSLYHFPKRYRQTLLPGTAVIYYKGRLRDQRFAGSRLSPEPHYFGIARIGSIHQDRQSDKGDLFATVEGYRPFTAPVLAKGEDGQYLETIPQNRATNYWRDGVRAISEETYNKVLKSAGLKEKDDAPKDAKLPDNDLESMLEGSQTKRFVTSYERNPVYRQQALAIHGLRCAACDLDMEERYGPYAKGLIHVHHTQPVSEFEAPRRIDPATDLVPVCPNCHAVIHRKKDRTLTIPDLRKMLKREG